MQLTHSSFRFTEWQRHAVGEMANGKSWCHYFMRRTCRIGQEESLIQRQTDKQILWLTNNKGNKTVWESVIHSQIGRSFVPLSLYCFASRSQIRNCSTVHKVILERPLWWWRLRFHSLLNEVDHESKSPFICRSWNHLLISTVLK